jgi:beta-mannosidase
MKLNNGWRMNFYEVGQVRSADVAAPSFDDRTWVGATVPGDVHSDLIKRGVIDHPYIGHNDLKCRWIETKEWWYRTSFIYRPEQEGERLELVFGGLDTYATVYVNGLKLGSTDNMFIRHRFPLDQVLVVGKNTIAVRFDPLHLHVQDNRKLEWSSYDMERPWVRKMQSQFGWDWGPRLVGVGIWGEVELVRRKPAQLADVYARTIELSGGDATLQLDVATERLSVYQPLSGRSSGGGADGEKRPGGATVESTSPLACTLTLTDADGERVQEMTVDLDAVTGGASVRMTVTAARLWWTHDLGEPHLYNLRVVLLVDGLPVDTLENKIGIRTLELTLKDADGDNTFAFLLNGVRVFAKGANWIPLDNLAGLATEERYRRLIDLSAEAHMNMLRVWGGGIYERAVFYEECDRRGLLVWQDFMFACALYPDYNRDFMDNVRREAVDAVKRLRNHASLALWCGNNENDWLHEMRGASGEFNCPFYGKQIYHELLPAVLAELDPERAYWPSSPFGGNDHNDAAVGDRHNWQVWHGSVYPRKFGEPQVIDYSVEGVSFKHFKSDLTLFNSEFGMHAAANRHTLSRHIPAGQFYWGSEEMAWRNKDANHQKGILLMEGYTGVPEDMETYIDYSMLTQAEGLKYGVEHYRRNRKRTSGTLIWQLNDSWPGTSWSIIDYDLLPKAAYYYAKRFFHPLLLTVDHEPDGPLALWLVNDTLADYAGIVKLEVQTFTGEVVFSRELAVHAPGEGAIQLGLFSEAELLGAVEGVPFADEQLVEEPVGLPHLGSAQEPQLIPAVPHLLTQEPQLIPAVPHLLTQEPQGIPTVPQQVLALTQGVVLRLSDATGVIPANLHYLRPQKDLLLPPIQLELRVDQERGEVTVRAQGGLARMVRLELAATDLHYSDNFFDLLAGESRTVSVRGSDGGRIDLTGLQVFALNGSADIVRPVASEPLLQI